MKLQLELGKTYVNRNGKRVMIVERRSHNVYKWLGDDESTYTDNGSYYHNSTDSRDLISLAEGTVDNVTEVTTSGVSDGSTASYYELPDGATQLQDLISHRDMNAQMGEIFRACYRYGIASHSDKMRDAKKIKFYIEAEIKRLEKLA